jgi:hypothetical protein
MVVVVTYFELLCRDFTRVFEQCYEKSQYRTNGNMAATPNSFELLNMESWYHSMRC